MLVLAVMAGKVVPGGRGWKARRDALVREFLRAAPDDAPNGMSRLAAIELERQARWAAQASPTLRRLYTAALPHLAVPFTPPDEAAELMEPLIWLTNQIGEGTKVSTAGTLNRPLVQAVDRRCEFNPTGRPPQSEAHVFQVTELRLLAQRMGLIRRTSTTLRATTLGRRLADDPAPLWQRFVSHALVLPSFDRFVAEVWLAAQVVDGPLRYPNDSAIAARAANESGWRRSRSGTPIDEDDVNDAINTIAWSFRLLRLLGEHRNGRRRPPHHDEGKGG